MLNLKTILNLGVCNPLILGMGHPVQTRLGRLMRPQKLRGGGMIASMLVASGLAVTSFASSNAFTLNVTVPATVEFYKMVSTDMDAMPRNVFEIRVFTDQHMGLFADEITYLKDKDGNENILSSDVIFATASKCVTHAKTNTLPMSYPVQARVQHKDTPDTLYLVYCTPQTDVDVTVEDIRAGNHLIRKREENAEYTSMFDAVIALKIAQLQTKQ